MSETAGGSLGLFKNREFVALASTAFARSQAFSTILIALGLYADIFGTTGTVEGLFGTAFALAQLLIVLPLGRAVDTHNAKRFLVVGLGINVLAFVGFALVGSATDVILVRILQGAGASVLWITGSAVVGELSPGDERGRWLGTYNQVTAFSSLAGDLVGGFLLFAYGFTLTYAVLSLVTILATLAVLAFLRDNPGGTTDPEEATGIETLRTLLDRAAVRALVVFRLGFGFGKMAVIIFLPIYAHTEFGMNPLMVGGILAGGKLTKSLLQGVVGSYTDRVGHKHQFVIAGALTYALGTAMVPFADSAAGFLSAVSLSAFGESVTLQPAFFVLFAAYAVIGVADSLRLPASMALFVEEGERFDAVAASLSLRSVVWKVGEVVGPLTVGALWDAASVFTAFFTAAGFIVLSTGVFVVLYRTEPAPSATPTPGD
ncbi:MFS transporter [Halococcus thailandensis]|uniref:Arabinose efflux permease n=1 Tax=Halococcus thailandensis JCM 13552 TaxID=1227457 RepID=M0N8L9_9EURY|nr:MFS transporter [Halococcus thailandensis]EMA54216.1 arabinose efflux permease [Halococcus thailandensis JCM 13552]